MHPFTLYKSREFAVPQPVELEPSIRPTRGSPYNLTPIICCPIGDLKAGDVIDVPVCYAQVSTKMTHALMVGSHLILTQAFHSSPRPSQNDFGPWLEISEATTHNITATQHHYPVRVAGRHVLQQDWPNAHLLFLIYTAWPTWNGSSLLLVDPDYGRMEGAIHRPATREEMLDFLGMTATPPAPPPPAPAPDPNMVSLSITRAHADALVAVAAQVPSAA